MEISEIVLGQKEYPPLLSQIQDAPGRIFVRGRLPDFTKPWIAVVGTRKAGESGLLLAKKLAKSLAEKGFVVVSGLAMGVDTAAHGGALLGGGETVAVLGCGVDKIYPAQNENLAREIFSGRGAIISEYPAGTPALPHRFLERNRIVAGLTLATIVIEAPKQSGAIVTARLAAEYGREVFVFPGTAGHPQYRGSHALIRDGARLVDSLGDILEDLNFASEGLFSAHHNNEFVSRGHGSEVALSGPRQEIGLRTEEEQKIFSCICSAKKPILVDKIAEITTLPFQVVHSVLAELTLKDIIEETSMGYSAKDANK